MTGKYRYKSGIEFTVILTKRKGREYLERARCKDFGFRLFTRVEKEDLEKELLTGEIEKI